MQQVVTKRLLVNKTTVSPDNYSCSVIATLKLFATKWKPCIICYLSLKSMRYNELHRIIPNISRKMLSVHLKELEQDGIVLRTQHDRKGQHVAYGLSTKGLMLLPVLVHLQDWGLKHLPNVVSINEMLNKTVYAKTA
jgi:DNA-binding HxlR family transcriptional regulator